MLSNWLYNDDVCKYEKEDNSRELHKAKCFITMCGRCESEVKIWHIFLFWDAMLIYIIQPFHCQTVEVH